MMSAALDKARLAGNLSEGDKDDLRLVFRVRTLSKRGVNQPMLSALGILFSQGNAPRHLTRSPEVSCQELAKLRGWALHKSSVRAK